MLVITEDLVVCKIGLARQGVDALQNLVKLLALSGGALLAGKPLQALLQGDTDGLR